MTTIGWQQVVAASLGELLGALQCQTLQVRCSVAPRALSMFHCMLWCGCMFQSPLVCQWFSSFSDSLLSPLSLAKTTRAQLAALPWKVLAFLWTQGCDFAVALQKHCKDSGPLPAVSADLRNPRRSWIRVYSCQTVLVRAKRDVRHDHTPLVWAEFWTGQFPTFLVGRNTLSRIPLHTPTRCSAPFPIQ